LPSLFYFLTNKNSIMAQYYLLVNLDLLQFMCSRDYGSGLTLMEHSWLHDSFVGVIVGLFLDSITGKTGREKTLYDYCREDEDEAMLPVKKVVPVLQDGRDAIFIVNHSKQQFASLISLPEEDPGVPGWQIHPLPLLTCCGNGRGGGDFKAKAGTPAIGRATAFHPLICHRKATRKLRLALLNGPDPLRLSPFSLSIK